MLRKLFPKEKDFFSSFGELTQSLYSSTSELLEVIQNKSYIDQAVQNTRTLDLKTDGLARRSIEQLHETFVTPFDRRQIFHFVTQIGEISSLTRLCVEKIQAYSLQDLPLETVALAVKCGESCSVLKQMVIHLQNLKNPQAALKLCLKIYKMRAESERLYFSLSKRLYAQTMDTVEMMKLKELNEDLVTVVRCFERISFLVEEMILEYA